MSRRSVSLRTAAKESAPWALRPHTVRLGRRDGGPRHHRARRECHHLGRGLRGRQLLLRAATRQDQQAGLHRAGLHHGRLLHRASDPSAKKESWKKESATTGDSATTGESAAGDSATTGESAKKESWKKESATTGESATTTEESTATTEESATTEAPAKKESWKKDKPWGGVHTGGGALAKVVAEDWGQDSGSSSESGSSWKKEKPAGGVHAGGGGLADSGGGLAAGSLLLLGGIGFGAYTLRRRNATSGAVA